MTHRSCRRPRAARLGAPAAARASRSIRATMGRDELRARLERRAARRSAAVPARRGGARARRARRRRRRPRSARALARRPDVNEIMVNGPGPGVRRTARPARARSTSRSTPTRSPGSPSGSSRRSACASITRRRSSTPASPTARGCTRCSRRSRPTARASRSGASSPRTSRSTRSASTRAAAPASRRWCAAGGTCSSPGRTSAGKTTLCNALARAIDAQRAHRHDRGDRRARARRSRTSCGSKRGRPTPKAWARCRCATWCGRRCACDPTG